MSFEYLIEAECLDCRGFVRVVEPYDEPVAPDTSVPISLAYCPRCGVEGPEWDRIDETRIERAVPPREP